MFVVVSIIFFPLIEMASTITFESVIQTSGQIDLSCVSKTVPMWVMQSGSSPTMRGIAVGEHKQSSFKDPRFASRLRFWWDVMAIDSLSPWNFHGKTILLTFLVNSSICTGVRGNTNCLWCVRGSKKSLLSTNLEVRKFAVRASQWFIRCLWLNTLGYFAL